MVEPNKYEERDKDANKNKKDGGGFDHNKPIVQQPKVNNVAEQYIPVRGRTTFSAEDISKTVKETLKPRVKEYIVPDPVQGPSLTPGN